jgi:glycolate oxidase subunit GlcD
MSLELVRKLEGVVGDGNVLTQPGELIPFESDALTSYRATPAAVVFVHETDEVQEVVSILHDAEMPYVPRGAGTGLSGGAVADGAVIIELSRMNRIIWIDPENHRARVQPGTVNAQLAEAVAEHGLMYAPDPSSQTACTLGGNVAENAGGPHCLKYGVTSNHILALKVVAPDGSLLELWGPLGSGYDLTGLFVGSEGTLGICCEIEVRLLPLPAAVETLLAHFEEIDGAGQAVSSIIAAGILPAALEMIDRETLKAVEASVYAAGFPTDVAASLIVELDGPVAGLAEQAAEVESLLLEHGAREVSRAKDEEERLKFWKARKSAFGAMGRIGSDLLVQDATVPRSKLPELLKRVYEVAREHDLTITNVFHAGDGNLHPNIPYDRREAGIEERVRAASRKIIMACVAAGGTITGEHGVGVDKRQYMSLVYSHGDRQTMRWVKQVFDPGKLCNPGKLLPDEPFTPIPSRGAGAGVERAVSKKDVTRAVKKALGSECLARNPESFVIDGEPAEVVATPGSVEELSELIHLASSYGWAVVPVGHGGWLETGNPLERADLVVSTRRMNDKIEHRPDDLLVTVGAGVSLADLNGTLAEAGQWWPIDPMGEGTVGAAIATGASGPLAAAYGAPRDLVLGLKLVRSDGGIVKAGGKVVKNVAGYDMVKLYTGSWGTLGIIAEAHLRLHSLPHVDQTRVFLADSPFELLRFAWDMVGAEKLSPTAAELMSPEAAAAIGMKTRDWRMAVRWLGHERAVNDSVTAAEKAASRAGLLYEEREEIWKALGSIEKRLGPAVTACARVPMRVTGAMVEVASRFAGADPPLVASPLLGRVRIFVPPELYEAAQGDRPWALRIEGLRWLAEERGGFVRVERGSPGLRAIVDPWGDLETVQRVTLGLKLRFDPDSTLKPGFFAGGL